METEKTGLPGSTARSPSFLRRHGRKLVALSLWLGMLGVYHWYAWQQDLTPLGAVQRLTGFMATGAYGPLVYIAFYAVRPLVLFPASLLTLAAGFVFGPVLGIVFTILGSSISAGVAYLVGRCFGGRLPDSGRAAGVTLRYADRLRSNSFESVLLMRLVYVPFDLVNYLAGFLRVGWRPFILATVLGSLPGTTSFVLFGASIEGGFTGGAPKLNLWVLLASVLMLVGGLLLSRYLKRRDDEDAFPTRTQRRA